MMSMLSWKPTITTPSRCSASSIGPRSASIPVWTNLESVVSKNTVSGIPFFDSGNCVVDYRSSNDRRPRQDAYNLTWQLAPAVNLSIVEASRLARSEINAAM